MKNEIISEGKKTNWGRALPSGHPDIQKRIDEVLAKGRVRREQAAKLKSESAKDTDTSLT